MMLGDGPEFEHLKHLAQEMKIDQVVRFKGWADDDLLFRTLATADLGVVPDIVNEMNDKSTMNKIMEYMAFGLPIV